jgi:hypothetical protein
MSFFTKSLAQDAAAAACCVSDDVEAGAIFYCAVGRGHMLSANVRPQPLGRTVERCAIGCNTTASLCLNYLIGSQHHEKN